MKNKSILLILSAVLLLVAVLLFWFSEDNTSELFSIIVSSGQVEEQITCWEDQEGQLYIFLPSYAGLSNTRVFLQTETPVKIGANILFDGMRCETFSLDTPYDLVYYSFGKRHERKITFMQSGGVATMYIDTQSGSMEFIHEKKGNEESGKLRLYTEDGALDYAGDLKSINGRGNGTWTDREKKAYSLTLEEKADLLGMGSAQKWILLANALDSSNLRNKIVYEFAKTIGMAYSPDSQWVDLYLNGEYAGLYLLCERNEVHPERIAISQTDSFLVSLELEERLTAQNYAHITTDANQALRIHYPHDITGEYLVELEAQWQSVENAISAEDGIDPVTGKSWLEQIDLDSWVRKYLIEEIFGNLDACRVSQFFYRDGTNPDGIIYAGPVWDFDNSIGNTSCWELATPISFNANQLHERDGVSAPWFFNLYQKEAFYNRVVELYQSEFLPVLESLINFSISDYAEHIQQAAVMNEIRWFENDTGFFQEVAYISNYMSRRIEFFSSVWCENVEYCLVKADYGYDCWYAVLPGRCLTELYEFEDTEYASFLGWYYSETDEPYDVTKPIIEDIEIYAKWETKSLNRVKQIAKLMPLGVIAIMGVVFLVIDIKRTKKAGDGICRFKKNKNSAMN